VSFLAAPRASSAPGSGATATDRRRLAIIMVGLPARGKSFTAHKLARYLTWLGHETRHFNVGKYRRDFVGRKCSAEFFDPGNDSAVASRNAVAKLAMEDMLAWMEQRGGQVGIFDATNSTRARRQMLTDMCRGRCKVIFLETVCTDMALIRRNVQEKVTASPDYAGTDPEEALRDFMRRMDEYEKAYEPLGSGPDELPEAHSFIRVVDIASGSGSMQVSRIQGYLPGRIVYFLLNAQLAFRPIYLCRHGKSEDNMAEKVRAAKQLISGRNAPYTRFVVADWWGLGTVAAGQGVCAAPAWLHGEPAGRAAVRCLRYALESPLALTTMFVTAGLLRCGPPRSGARSRRRVRWARRGRRCSGALWTRSTPARARG
jgi:predicted kinase